MSGVVWRLPFPVDTITSSFGYRTAPYKAFHTGVDFGSNRGKPIHAPSAGVAVAKGYNSNKTSGWGHYLWVQATDGAFYGVAHMAAASPFNVGDRVNLGDTLGTVGATGAAATYGPHLHLSVSTGTKAQAVALSRDHLVDPITYINARTSGTAGGIEEEMQLSDTVRELNVENYGVIDNQAVTIGNRFEWISWWAKRAQMSIDGQRPSLISQIRDKVNSISTKVDTLSSPSIPAATLVAALSDPSVVNAIAQKVASLIQPSLDDIPTNGEMGQALTSTVALVNEHADENKDAIIAAIPSGSGSGGSASTYSLNLDIDQVPGTATGTATPQ